MTSAARAADSTYYARSLPRVLAHRGLATAAPENTLLAFSTALAAGADYIETDVHASRDGIAVISHDPDLTRLVGRQSRVEGLTLEQLTCIDLGGGQSFCSLASALEAFPDTRFNIDIKSMSAAVPAARAILDAGARRRVLVTSFGDRRRRAALRLLPGVATSAAALPFAFAFGFASLGLLRVSRLLLRRVNAVQVPERWMLGPLRVDVVTPRFIAQMHLLAIEVHVWTINDPRDMRRLLDMGVDGIVTDRADIALDLIRSRTPST